MDMRLIKRKHDRLYVVQTGNLLPQQDPVNACVSSLLVLLLLGLGGHDGRMLTIRLCLCMMKHPSCLQTEGFISQHWPKLCVFVEKKNSHRL